LTVKEAHRPRCHVRVSELSFLCRGRYAREQRSLLVAREPSILPGEVIPGSFCSGVSALAGDDTPATFV
jgi:hypothetical protein